MSRLTTAPEPGSEELSSYAAWIVQFDTPSRGAHLAQRRVLRALRKHPRISILLPVFNPNLLLLREAIDSVHAQTYDAWELCIADDASTDPAVRPFLEDAIDRDARVRATFRATNGHIAAASNSALELATGEWCALLDQDDVLAPHALACIAVEAARHPDARVMYSDEDKVNLDGIRSTPFFKTDWDPELILAQNYINHLGAYETGLLRSLSGFREGYEGSQDYDLALRCCENIGPSQVRHIPRILYHWRAAPGSVAHSAGAKPYAKQAARRAITDHLQRRAIAGQVVACPENDEVHRVIYEIPDPAPLVTIVIPTRDHTALLRRCLGGIRAGTDYPSIEVTIVDNDSTQDEAVEYLAQLRQEPAVTVLSVPGAFNFSRLNNLAANEARGEILIFLNNDVEITEPGWLTEMVRHAIRPEVGAVGARLWYPNGTLQHAGVVLGLGGVAGHAHLRLARGHGGYFDRAFHQRNCSAVTAACMATRRSVFEQLGGFDDLNLSVSFNDIDYCLRVAAKGWQIVWTPGANLVHHESASRGHNRSDEEKAQFVREASYMQEKHGVALLSDPFYNPNLSLQLPGYELAFPPRVQSLVVTLV